jgi:hypothetical protein
MTDTFTLASADDVADLTTFAQRAERLGCALMRLTVVGSHLAVTVCVLEKQGLLDSHPYVFGLRVFELSRDEGDLANNGELDVLIETRALLDRLARMNVTVDVPVSQARVPWAGVAAPRDGWVHGGSVGAAELIAVAKSGIDEVASANGLGTNIVTEVRRTVWTRRVGESGIFAGMAFAAFGLGFAREGTDDQISVTTNGSWTRITTARGYVLARI